MALKAKFPGYCQICNQKFIVGESDITKDDDLSEKANQAIWIHESCVESPTKESTGPWDDGIETVVKEGVPNPEKGATEEELNKVFGGTNVEDLDNIDDLDDEPDGGLY